MKKLTFILALLALLIPSTALAHNIGGSGALSGLTHPLFGLDHLLAMVAVGVISTVLGGKAVFKVPATFIGFMLIGGIIGMMGISLFGVEIAIALSVLLLGSAIALNKKIPNIWAMMFVAIFAIFHGHAHGAEMPLISNAALYAIGFISSTTILHITGVLIGHFAQKTQFTKGLLRFAGAGVGFMGFLFLFSII
ncbi:HupE/UreJ family protein [Patescibacteria group bacterium]